MVISGTHPNSTVGEPSNQTLNKLSQTFRSHFSQILTIILLKHNIKTKLNTNLINIHNKEINCESISKLLQPLGPKSHRTRTSKIVSKI